MVNQQPANQDQTAQPGFEEKETTEQQEPIQTQPVQTKKEEEKQPTRAQPTQEVPKEEQPEVPQKSAGRILLIEDDLPMVKMYSTKLEKENFEVEVAYDGEEGLEKIKKQSPDLVVLDLMIPKIGGMELLEKMRADPKTKNVPVIILSNLSQEQDIQRSKELGVKEFLIKANFTPSQVVEKMKECLEK